MTKPTRADDPWEGIGPDPAQLVGRRIDEDHVLSIYWVRGDDGAPGLLIRGIEPQGIPRVLPKPRGIGILTNTADRSGPWARLVLQSSEDRDVFTALCRDVIAFSAGEKTASDATASIFLRLARWHALLSRGRSTEMGPQEIRGLIGELRLLEMLAMRIGYSAALQTWVAPEDHPQDFALDTSIIEVKTRLSGSRQQIQISSLEQLESAHLPLNLLVFELAPSDASDAFSLNDIAARLMYQFQAAGTAVQEAADIAMASRGYLRKDAYDIDRYVVAGLRAFSVTGDFPRLTRTSIDARVHQATYILDLTALAAFERDVVGVTSPASTGGTLDGG